MGNILDLAYGILTQPRKTLSDITYGEKIKEAFVLWLFQVVLFAVSDLSHGMGIALSLIISFVAWALVLFVHAAIIDYISGLLGGRGTAKGITAGLMATKLPQAVLVVGSFFTGLGVSFVSGVLFIAVGLWVLYLEVLAISENYRFEKGKSLAVALFPYLLIVLMLLIFFMIGVMAAVMGISTMGEDLNSLNSILQ